jgi:peptidoglycan hydrolase CwlO-like protein
MFVVTAVLLPAASRAEQAQEGPQQSTRERQTEVRQRQGEVALEVDVLEAREADVRAALATLDANVAAQQGKVDESQRSAAAAAEDVVEAEAAVTAAEGRISELDEATDDFVVEAYVSPPSDSALDALSAESISDATVKQVLLDIQADSDADVFDQLREAHEDLAVERVNKEAVAAEAEQKRIDAEDELSQLEAARAQQATFVADAEAALDHKLVEADNLAGMDAELSRQIAAEQAELARQLEAARQAAGGGAPPAPSGPGTIMPIDGGLAEVSCPNGGSITIASSVAPSLRGLMDAAAASGVSLCGWGYRSGQRQIELRRQHCGTSDYAVWSMPSWQCSPPTARPGFSMHERGLAVDFTCAGGSIGSRSNRCFRWLSEHAAQHGLYNLPSEPWHWSTNGR